MDKRDNPFFSYAYLDSQRLKDTFFSPPKKKRKKKTHKKNIFIIAGCAVLIAGACLFFFAKYDLMVISRKLPGRIDNGVSLLSKDMLDSAICIAKDEGLMKKENALIYLAVPKESAAISFNLKKPVDLRSNSLSLYIKKSDTPLNIAVVVKDTRFFSNSLKPLMIKVTQKDSSFIKVPISFSDLNLQNTNLYQVKQIILYFYPEDKERTNWTLIKDLVLI
ncbi:MAG: hypothetical protein PHP17_02820 [Candidatus Omnitrophica bacterium]|nr:hypothetical protein [Candidatus Omnitrophota bacterium]